MGPLQQSEMLDELKRVGIRVGSGSEYGGRGFQSCTHASVVVAERVLHFFTVALLLGHKRYLDEPRALSLAQLLSSFIKLNPDADQTLGKLLFSTETSAAASAFARYSSDMERAKVAMQSFDEVRTIIAPLVQCDIRLTSAASVSWLTMKSRSLTAVMQAFVAFFRDLNTASDDVCDLRTHSYLKDAFKARSRRQREMRTSLEKRWEPFQKAGFGSLDGVSAIVEHKSLDRILDQRKTLRDRVTFFTNALPEECKQRGLSVATYASHALPVSVILVP